MAKSRETEHKNADSGPSHSDISNYKYEKRDFISHTKLLKVRETMVIGKLFDKHHSNCCR